MAEGEARKRAGEPGIDATDASTRKKKPKQARATFIVPLQGIRNCEGDLFHHTAPRRLCEKGRQRLEDAGITIKATHFDKNEDEIVQRNWYEFADQYGLKDKDALYLCGVDAKSRGAGMDERSVFIQKSRFFPKICRKLEHRTGETVIAALRRMFDPNTKDPNRDFALKFTEEEDKMLREYYQKGWTLFKIAEAMKKPKARIQSRIKYFRKQGLTREADVPDDAKNAFYWATSYSSIKSNGFAMPETGVLDQNGDFFYHAHMVHSLSLANVERLQKHGLLLETTRMDGEEKRKALRNATKLMNEFKFSKLAFIWILGYAKYAKALHKHWASAFPEEDERFFEWSFQQRAIFTSENRFWPRLCEGFPNRPSAAVAGCVRGLIDPANELPGAQDRLTEEQYHEFDRVYRIHHSLATTAGILGMPFLKAFMAIKNNEYRATPLRVTERRRLWNILEKRHSGGGKKLIMDEIQKGKSKFNAKKMAITMSRHTPVIVDAWKELVGEFQELLEHEDFEDVFEKVIPKPYPITGREFSDFLELFIDYNPKIVVRKMRFTDTDRLNLERRMIRMGLTGFNTQRFTELHFCRRMLGKILCQICTNLKPVVDLTTVARNDALKVLSKTIGKLGDAPFRKLATKDFIDTLVSHMAENHPTWQPTKGLLEWSEELGKQTRQARF